MSDMHGKNAGGYVCPVDKIHVACHKIGREFSAGLHISGACGWLGQHDIQAQKNIQGSYIEEMPHDQLASAPSIFFFASFCLFSSNSSC